MLIERIGHFADFHIFRNKRHQEHRELIPKLVKTFKTEKVDLIYVGGDIIDSKSKLSPEQNSSKCSISLRGCSGEPCCKVNVPKQEANHFHLP